MMKIQEEETMKRYKDMKKNTFVIKPPTPSKILTPFLQLMDGGLLNLFWNLKNIIKSQALQKTILSTLTL